MSPTLDPPGDSDSEATITEDRLSISGTEMAPTTSKQTSNTARPPEERKMTSSGMGALSRLPRELLLMILEYVPHLEYKTVFTETQTHEGCWPVYAVSAPVLLSCRSLYQQLSSITEGLNERYPATLVVNLDAEYADSHPIDVTFILEMAVGYDLHWLKSNDARGDREQAQIGKWAVDIPTRHALRNWSTRLHEFPGRCDAQNLRAFFTTTVIRLRRRRRLRVIQLAPPTSSGQARTKVLLHGLNKIESENASVSVRSNPNRPDVDYEILLQAPNEAITNIKEHVVEPKATIAASRIEHVPFTVSWRYALDEEQHLFERLAKT